MNRVWHKGPPPHVGWWNASAIRAKNLWRWWDGRRWSECAADDEGVWMAARAADCPTVRYPNPDVDIEWTDFYPENARVPRINPNE